MALSIGALSIQATKCPGMLMVTAMIAWRGRVRHTITPAIPITAIDLFGESRIEARFWAGRVTVAYFDDLSERPNGPHPKEAALQSSSKEARPPACPPRTEDRP